jgi:hydroxymethylbilane synthase
VARRGSGSPTLLRLGTRGSPLAIWQANRLREEILASDPDLRVTIVPIRTTGDRIIDQPLAEIGGKGLFTRELDAALLGGRIDCAVHSLKDLPFLLPEGIELAAVLRRGDPRDALVSDGFRWVDLPPGARVGTGSLRRRAQLLNRHPSLCIEPLRGNVGTRLRKLETGNLDAIVLSAAGLDRLGYADRISEYLDPEDVLPAVGQGAVAAVCRAEDLPTRRSLAALEDAATRVAVTAERQLLEVLEGSCQVPVGGFATLDGDRLSLRGLVAMPDGTRLIRDRIEGPSSAAVELGRGLGERILKAGGREILGRVQRHEP